MSLKRDLLVAEFSFQGVQARNLVRVCHAIPMFLTPQAAVYSATPWNEAK
jgi:hypothetical protein